MIHKCDICGKADEWNESWAVYGSILHEDSNNREFKTCSEECRAKVSIETIDRVVGQLRMKYPNDVRWKRPPEWEWWDNAKKADQ